MRVIDNPRPGRPAIDSAWIGVEGVVIHPPAAPWVGRMVWIEFDPLSVEGSPGIRYNQQPFFPEDLEAIGNPNLAHVLRMAGITEDEAATVIAFALAAWDDHNVKTALQSFTDPEEIAELLARAAKAYFADSPKDGKYGN